MFKYWNSLDWQTQERIVFGSVILLIAFCIGLLITAAIVVGENKSRLIKQCMDDGKKEYECESMLKQDVIPVYIPSGR